jgi:uncharacterized membrane protein
MRITDVALRKLRKPTPTIFDLVICETVADRGERTAKRLFILPQWISMRSGFVQPLHMTDFNVDPVGEQPSVPLPITQQQVNWRQCHWVLFARVCLFAALCGAGYLAMVSLTGAAIAGCGPGSGCNQVLSSRWAYWFGLPVSVPAFLSYLALLALITIPDQRQPAAGPKLRWQAIVCLSVLVLFAAVYFVLLQIVIVKAWCKFCLATHASATAGGAALLMTTIQPSATGQTSGGIRLKLRESLVSVLGAVLALIILVTGQLAVKKRLYGASLFSGLFDSGSDQIRLHAGKFKLVPADLPVLGAVPATNYIVSLFDYTCSHCRALHPILKQAQERYQARLSIIALPTPLDAACNPLIVVTAPANQNACEYARLSLAVWHVRHEAFPEFDDWLFSAAVLPSIEQARSRAQELVGKEALAESLKSPWVEHQLQVDVSLYQNNSQAVRDGRLPQLNIGDLITHGAIDSQQDLSRLIEQHLHP